jgi:hypothetical protein
MGKKNQTFGEIAETAKLQNLKPEQGENVSTNLVTISFSFPFFFFSKSMG